MELINDSLLKDLIHDFLAESFSQKNHFESKNLETICAEMLNYKRELMNASYDPSWERTHGTLCLMLSHLDALGVEQFPAAVLKDFLNQPLELDGRGSDFEIRKEGLALCWALKKKISEAYQNLEQQYQHICPTQRPLQLNDWALCVLSRGHSNLAQLLFQIREKEEQAQRGDPYISFVWLMELKKEFNAAVLDLERANLSKAA